MQFLQPKFIFFIALFFSYNCIMHIWNLVYVRKIQILEELLHSKLRCTFYFLRPIVKISGNYNGRKLIFWSCPWVICRASSFCLKSSKLPKQKKLMFTYPQVAPGISQEGDMLVSRVADNIFTSRLAAIGKSWISSILDSLVRTAEQLEENKKSGEN